MVTSNTQLQHMLSLIAMSVAIILTAASVVILYSWHRAKKFEEAKLKAIEAKTALDKAKAEEIQKRNQRSEKERLTA